jgi:hypothetical protein
MKTHRSSRDLCTVDDGYVLRRREQPIFPTEFAPQQNSLTFCRNLMSSRAREKGASSIRRRRCTPSPDRRRRVLVGARQGLDAAFGKSAGELVKVGEEDVELRSVQTD